MDFEQFMYIPSIGTVEAVEGMDPVNTSNSTVNDANILIAEKIKCTEKDLSKYN